MNPRKNRLDTGLEAHPSSSLPEQLSAMRALSAGVAHEIRNPLAVIQSLVEHLAKKTEDETQKKIAEAVVSEVGRLNEVVTEFLEFTSTPPLHFEKTVVKTLIDRALAFAIHPEKHRDIIVKTHIPDDMPEVELDPAAFHQVLLNTLLNAIQAMKGSGTLEIHTSISDHHFIVQIKDTGPGIPPENQEEIFLPFVTTKRGGAGLGLAISHQIITRHGGTIFFKNSEGKGVALFIDVPRKQNRKK